MKRTDLCRTALLLVLGLPWTAAGHAATDDPKAAWKALYEDGKAALRWQEFERARELLGQALEVARELGPLDIRMGQTVLWLAESHRLEGRPRKGLRLFDDELARIESEFGAEDPHSALLRLFLGIEYGLMRRFGDAEKASLQALSLVESDPEQYRETITEGLSQLAQLYQREGRTEEAIRAMERAAELNEGDERFFERSIYHRLAEAYSKSGDLEKAERAYSRLLAALLVHRGEESSYVLVVKEEYADVLRRLGREDEAAELLRSRLPEIPVTTPGPSPDEVLTAGMNGVPRPRLVRDVDPIYPDEAREAGAAGKVILSAIVAPDGTVPSAEVLQVSDSGLGFEQAAKDAILKRRYEPAMVDGRAVPVRIIVVVEFGLSGSAPGKSRRR
jgi:TonB family protein